MTTTSSSVDGTTRRQLLRTGALGAAAAAFLAACGTKTDAPSGASGVDPTTTLVMPTVPLKEASEAELTNDITVLRTAASMELLAAELYTKYGPKLSDAAWQATAARFAEDHTAAAAAFTEATPEEARIDAPNEYLTTNVVDPLNGTLNNDSNILNLFRTSESTICATYIAAVGSATEADWRSSYSAYANAAARRVGVLGNAGAGEPPTSALYGPEDLIPGDAYLPVDAPAE